MTSKKRTIQTGLIKQWVAAIMFACGSLTAVGQWQTQSLTLSPGWNAVYLHVDSMHSGIAAMANGTPVEEVLAVLQLRNVERGGARCFREEFADPARVHELAHVCSGLVLYL